MHLNPYQSPTTYDRAVSWPAREQALWRFRMAFLVLLVGALWNYCAFDAIATEDMPAGFALVMRVINTLAFIGGSLLIWFLALPFLEGIAAIVRNLAARHTDPQAWNEVLYRALNRTLLLAIPGSLLWIVWVWGFYLAQVDFFVISWAIGVPAHLLGACLYVPLLVGWYRLARNQAVPSR